MEEWASLIRIPSVSCQEEHKADMTRCAERWKELLLEAGCQKAEVLPSKGNPFVYGEFNLSGEAGLTAKRSVSETVCQQRGLSGVAGPYDYIKLGPYIESLGGLKSPKTNQRLYKRVGDEWQDITSSFWKKNL